MMKIFVNPDCRLSPRGAVVTIGSFDGVHYGHRAILSAVCSIARQRGLESTLITLFPHPRKVLGIGTDGFGVLNTLPEKEALIARCGIDNLVELEFTPQVAAQSAEAFAERILVGTLNAKVVVVGYNHHFGHNRSGDYSALVEIGVRLGFEVVEISKHDLNQEKISSTVIRKALAEGDMARVNRYLGYDYAFDATFADNDVLKLSDEMKMLPATGEYRVRIESEHCSGVEARLRVDGRHLTLLACEKMPTETVRIIFC